MNTSWRSVLYGAVGGLVGAAAMHRFRIVWDKRQSANADSGIFGFDAEADIRSVDAIWSSLSLPPLSEKEALSAALVLHYSFGVASGGAYGFACAQVPSVAKGFGVLFGTSLWLIGDEFAITAAGFSDPLSKVPAAHLSALFAHVLFGITADVVRRAMNKAMSPDLLS